VFDWLNGGTTERAIGFTLILLMKKSLYGSSKVNICRVAQGGTIGDILKKLSR